MGAISNMNLVKDMTTQIFWAAFFSSLGGIGFGIDYGFWSGMLDINQFLKDFGVYDAKAQSYYLPSTWKSVGSGLPVAGLAIGSLLSSAIGIRLGRIRTFRIASVISAVGIIIQSTAIHSYWQIMVGRIVNTLALGILANAIPTYLAEISPLSIRGTLINCYQFSVSVGAVLVTTMNWGMHLRTDQWAYRLVLLIQILVPIFYIIGSFFVPESPRWLIGNGQFADAEKELRLLRKDTSTQVIEREVQLIIAAEEDNKRQFSGSWMECIRGPNLRRTLIATGVQCLQQAQGSSFMGTYSVLFMESIGVRNVYEISVLTSLVMAVGSGCAFYIADKFGRRWILICAALVLGTSMFVMSGVKNSGLAGNMTAANAALAFIFIWQFAMSIGWSSCVWIVTAEVPTLQLREKTITIATFLGFCVSILVTFVSPFIQDERYGNLGGYIGFLYGSFSFAAAIWTFLFCPETGFRSLEELDELFQNHVSVWRFRTYETSGFGAELAQVEQASGPGMTTPGKPTGED
ncbi:Major facilitator superfamily domain general substrate transporter [Penicillium sp. IBT 35674x]|nr:Major facilitator superfamily domain general substrate transporter [Penicillium sp. IBT 35674x]